MSMSSSVSSASSVSFSTTSLSSSPSNTKDESTPTSSTTPSSTTEILSKHSDITYGFIQPEDMICAPAGQKHVWSRNQNQYPKIQYKELPDGHGFYKLYKEDATLGTILSLGFELCSRAQLEKRKPQLMKDMEQSLDHVSYSTPHPMTDSSDGTVVQLCVMMKPQHKLTNRQVLDVLCECAKFIFLSFGETFARA